MKRFILVLFMFGSLLSSVVASNYSDAKVVKDVGLPSFVSHIEFWNGGSKIYEADNASIIILIQTNENFLSCNKVQFYVYKVTSDKGTCKIINSETMAILYKD